MLLDCQQNALACSASRGGRESVYYVPAELLREKSWSLSLRQHDYVELCDVLPSVMLG